MAAKGPKSFVSSGIKYIQMYFASRDREYVSNWWFVLLWYIYKAGTVFNVNEGKRTMGRQQQLVNELGVWSPSNPHGAARPSKLAPHIREGHHDHAIDFDNASGVIVAAAKKGVRLIRTVSTEPWHLQPDVDDLKRFYVKHVAYVVAHWKFKKKAPKPKKKPPKKPPVFKAPSKISKTGTTLIASFEGFRSAPYKDTVGVWTIGYGHTHGVTSKSKHLTKKQALALLKSDLDKVYAPPVAKRAKQLGLKLNQHQFDALVSAVYNLGPGIMDPGRSMGDAMRSKSKQKMADAFLPYVYGGGRKLPGLVIRRKAERKLFLS